MVQFNVICVSALSFSTFYLPIMEGAPTTAPKPAAEEPKKWYTQRESSLADSKNAGNAGGYTGTGKYGYLDQDGVPLAPSRTRRNIASPSQYLQPPAETEEELISRLSKRSALFREDVERHLVKRENRLNADVNIAEKYASKEDEEEVEAKAAEEEVEPKEAESSEESSEESTEESSEESKEKYMPSSYPRKYRKYTGQRYGSYGKRSAPEEPEAAENTYEAPAEAKEAEVAEEPEVKEAEVVEEEPEVKAVEPAEEEEAKPYGSYGTQDRTGAGSQAAIESFIEQARKSLGKRSAPEETSEEPEKTYEEPEAKEEEGESYMPSNYPTKYRNGHQYWNKRSATAMYNGEKVEEEEEVKEPAEVKDEEKVYMNENMGEYGNGEEYSRYGKRSAPEAEEETVTELPAEKEETSQKPYARRPYGRNPRRYNNANKARKSFTPVAVGDYYHGDSANRGEYASGVNYSKYGKRSAQYFAVEGSEPKTVTEAAAYSSTTEPSGYAANVALAFQ